MPLLQEFFDFLATLPVEYLLLFAISGLLLFTLGLLLGWLIQKRKTAQFRSRARKKEAEREALQRKLAEADEEQKKLARELIASTTEKDDSLVQLRETRGSLQNVQGELERQRAVNEQLNATNQSYATTIEDLNDQVIGLKTRNEQLLPGTRTESTRSLEERLLALETRLSRLDPEDEEEPVLDLGRPRHEVRIGESFAELRTHHDDLTRIRSIGPFNQRKLHEIGITTFAQIADWKDAELEDYAARIGYAAQLMREEDWIGQARKLAVAAPASSGLQVVAGIDDQIAEVLKEAGIHDLQTLAATPAGELEAILQQSDQDAATGDPAGWPEQAALAAAGEWRKLREWQDRQTQS